jgi:nitrate reductase NapE component
MTELTRADLDQLRIDMNQQFTGLRIEWRQEMLTHIRWLVGLFVVQFIATVGATAGIVGWMLNIASKHI